MTVDATNRIDNYFYRALAGTVDPMDIGAVILGYESSGSINQDEGEAFLEARLAVSAIDRDIRRFQIRLNDPRPGVIERDLIAVAKQMIADIRGRIGEGAVGILKQRLLTDLGITSNQLE